MNIKEAIENIKDCVLYSIKQHNWREEQDAYDEESLTIAVAAMEKQDPMKPYFEHGYFCSGCNSEIVPGTDYCWNCGQKLDWED